MSPVLPGIVIRSEAPGDAPSIRSLTDTAFAPALRLPAWTAGHKGTMSYPAAFDID